MEGFRKLLQCPVSPVGVFVWGHGMFHTDLLGIYLGKLPYNDINTRSPSYVISHSKVITI
jgi:hypothetical protein